MPLVDVRSPEARDFVGNQYHGWFYLNTIWEKMKWCGIPTWKSPSDMWNYQEIISEMKPGLIVEFGTYKGGSALFFANVLRQLGHRSRVLTVDYFDHGIDKQVLRDRKIERLFMKSTDKRVPKTIRRLRKQYPGPVFWILDSDHSLKNVLAELKMIRPLTKSGDYVITEDSNINGHPIHIEDHDNGPGPYEAVQEYEREFPHDYFHDTGRELKFAWTLSPNGFLIRR